VWPLFLDGFVLVGSLFVLRAALAGQRAWYPLLLVVAGNVASIAFNVFHVGTAAERITAAVPPVAALLAFELATRELYKALRGRTDTTAETEGRTGPATGQDGPAASQDGPGPDRTEDGTGPAAVETASETVSATGEELQVSEGRTGAGTEENAAVAVLSAEEAQGRALEAWRAARPAAEVAREVGRDPSLIRRWFRKWDAQDGPAESQDGQERRWEANERSR
jgi:hypothetical protein